MINLLIISLSLFNFFGADLNISTERPLLVILVFCFANSYLVGRLWMTIISSRIDIPQFSFNLLMTVAIVSIGSIIYSITGQDLFYLSISIPFLVAINFCSWLFFFDKFTKELSLIEGIYRFKLGKLELN